jgi:hypothetical protein
MDKLNRLLSEIDQMRIDHAIQAMTNPTSRDAFGYGQAIGLHQGICLVKEKLLAILKEDDIPNAKSRKS